MTIVIPLVTVVMAPWWLLFPWLLLLYIWFWRFLLLLLLFVLFCFTVFFCLKLLCIIIYKHTLSWIKYPCSTRDFGPPRTSFLHLLFINSCPQVLVCQEDHNKCCPNRDLEFTGSGRSDWDLLRPGKCRVMGQMDGKPHHFFNSFHYLFKVQGLLVLHND